MSNINEQQVIEYLQNIERRVQALDQRVTLVTSRVEIAEQSNEATKQRSDEAYSVLVRLLKESLPALVKRVAALETWKVEHTELVRTVQVENARVMNALRRHELEAKETNVVQKEEVIPVLNAVRNDELTRTAEQLFESVAIHNQHILEAPYVTGENYTSDPYQEIATKTFLVEDDKVPLDVEDMVEVKPKKTKVPMTIADYDFIQDKLAEGKSLAQIATLMGRPYSSVNTCSKWTEERINKERGVVVQQPVEAETVEEAAPKAEAVSVSVPGLQAGQWYGWNDAMALSMERNGRDDEGNWVNLPVPNDAAVDVQFKDGEQGTLLARDVEWAALMGPDAIIAFNVREVE